MPATASIHSLWETVKHDFKGLFPEDVYQLWFEPMECLEATTDSIALGVPNDFAAIWINDNYLDLIAQRLHLTAGRAITVKLRKSGASPTRLPDTRPARETTPAKPGRSHLKRVGREQGENSGGALNARNTFETFVVGNNNQMAQAAVMVVV